MCQMYSFQNVVTTLSEGYRPCEVNTLFVYNGVKLLLSIVIFVIELYYAVGSLVPTVVTLPRLCNFFKVLRSDDTNLFDIVIVVDSIIHTNNLYMSKAVQLKTDSRDPGNIKRRKRFLKWKP